MPALHHPFVPGASDESILRACAPLLAAVEHAGRAIEAVQAARDDDGVNVERKGDGSPVTAADLAANAVLVPALEAAFPDIPVVSEETWEPGMTVPATSWVIDPLDGTKEFIKQNGEYVVNVGLMVAGVPAFGIVHVPTTGESFVGGAGIGCWRVAAGEWLPLQATPYTGGALRLVASRSHAGPAVESMLGRLARHDIQADRVPMGSAWKLVLIAEDKADCYPRLGPTMWWDTLAPQAVVEGAGGRVLNVAGERFQYLLDTDGEPRNRYFLVLGPPGPSDDAIVSDFAAAASES